MKEDVLARHFPLLEGAADAAPAAVSETQKLADAQSAASLDELLGSIEDTPPKA